MESLSGATGSLIALLATYPLKTLYTLQAIDARSSPKSVDSAKRHLLLQLLRNPHQTIRTSSNLLSHQKLRVLYSGIKPAAIETPISSAIYFYIYSLLRSAVILRSRRTANRNKASGQSINGSRNEQIGVGASLLVAALAAAGNQLLTSPLQVITTQMQSRSKHKKEAPSDADDSML